MSTLDIILDNKNKKEYDEIVNPRTEEVADIIERMPKKFGFWVSTIVVTLFLLLLLFGYIIKYPDVLRGQVTISTRQAPVKLIAPNTGRIQLLHNKTGDSINSNEYIAVIENAANTNDIRLVDSFLKKINIHKINYYEHRKYFPENVSLGEINNKYFAFLNALYQYLDYYYAKPYDKQKDILQKLSYTQKTTLQQSIDEYSRLKSKYQLALSFYKRESALYDQGVISSAELEKARVSLINSEQEFKTVNKDITTNKYQIDDAGNKLQQLVFQKIDKDRQLQIDLLNSYYEIQEGIRQWEHKYVFISPIKGKVEFLNFWKTDDYIQAGQEMFFVLPQENEVYGQVFIPEQGAGKIKIGQPVIIKLDNYPYTQYGSIKGTVKSISPVTNQQALSNTQNKVAAYLVTLDLPEGLITNYGTSLSFHFESKGIAEIVTNDRRLIFRLFDNLKHSVK